jgi:molybdenum cofactor biosynthesis enzyme MoaA
VNPRPLQWLEVTPGFRCNQGCLGCFSVVDPARLPPDARTEMDAREVLDALARGRRDGARALWIGGGEPTLRRDLLATVRAARQMGYDRIKLQTNGMLLAYPDHARACAAAGVTEVAFALKGATAESHDRWTRTPGAHALLRQAMGHVRALGLPLEADVLVYRSTAHELPDLVRAYTPLGVGHYRLWLLSASDDASDEVRREIPRLSDVAPWITAAMDLGLSPREDFITSLHTPACTLPVTHHRALFFAPDLAMRVANPGGHSLLLEDSPMEGGAYLPGCAGCVHRPRCGGPRRDYLQVHGPGEFVPRLA